MSVADAVKEGKDRLFEVLGSGASAERSMGERVCLVVLVDAEAPAWLVQAMRGALLPAHTTGEVQVHRLDASTCAASQAVDACVVVCGGSDALVEAAASSFARLGTPVALVAESALDAPVPTVPGVPQGLISAFCSHDAQTVLIDLAYWLVAMCPKSISLAANFPFCRKAVANRLVSACAAQNALLGATDIVPGAAYPVLTANQAKLALDLAAAYGQDISLERTREVAGVAGAGLAWRAIAKALRAAIPGIDIVIKTGTAYLGTIATGKVLQAHMERQRAKGGANTGLAVTRGAAGGTRGGAGA